MSEKESYVPTPKEVQAAEVSMTAIERMDSKYREKAAKDGEWVTIDEEGDNMKIVGGEIFLGRYMTISDRKGIKGKKEFEEEPISAEGALKRLNQDEVSVEMEMERLRCVLDNIGILKNRILAIQEKQEKKES